MPCDPRLRRQLLLATAGGGTLWSLGLPAQAQAERPVLPSMTDGPFYPPRRWRERETDWDADLTQVRRGAQTRVARGEHLALLLAVIDTHGRVVDGAEVEIWQCDAAAVYHHPDVRPAPGQADDGFQGFGQARSGKDGQVRFRTIRPVPYPGRTPHIHVKLRHASFGEWTSQLFVSGEAGNDRDFLWRSLRPAAREAATMRLARVAGEDGLVWSSRVDLVLPA